MDGNELALLAGIMLTGLFKYLVQAHSFEELLLNLQIVAIALGKVTKEPSRSAIAQGFDQCLNAVTYRSRSLLTLP
jgi:hypothetical protein